MSTYSARQWPKYKRLVTQNNGWNHQVQGGVLSCNTGRFPWLNWCESHTRVWSTFGFYCSSPQRHRAKKISRLRLGGSPRCFFIGDCASPNPNAKARALWTQNHCGFYRSNIPGKSQRKPLLTCPQEGFTTLLCQTVINLNSEAHYTVGGKTHHEQNYNITARHTCVSFDHSPICRFV